MSNAGTPATPAPSQAEVIVSDISKAVDIIGAVLPLFVPGGTVIAAGLSLTKLLTIAQGAANQAPAMVQIWNEMLTLRAQSTAPTAAQWAAWDQAADDAYNAVQADLSSIEAKDPTKDGTKITKPGTSL